MKPKLTAAQKRTVRRTLDAIEAQPRRFDMDLFAQTDPKCGTVCCFAGHLACAVTKQPLDKVDPHHESINGRHVGVIAHEFLGFNTSADADVLFLTSNWPEKFEAAHDARKTPLAKAHVLRQRIEHWMATGE